MSGGGEFFYNYLEYREFPGVMRSASFYSLLTAAFMRADSTNTAKIRLMWPEFAAEMGARYNAPGGVLPDDWRPEPLGGVVPGEHGGLPEDTPTAEKAPRCVLSGATVLIPREIWAESETERYTCHQCGQKVRFRVRVTDVPPAARLLPHRTDGTPCR